MRRHGSTSAIALACLALALCVCAGGPLAQGAARSVTWPTRTMGTYANVTIVTADSAASLPLARIAQRALTRVDSLMSNWTTTSEVARINRDADSTTVTVEPEVARVIDASLVLWRASGGAFDITVEPLIRLWGFIGGPKRVPSDAEIAAVLPRVGAGQVSFDPSTRRIRFAREGVKIDLGGIAKGYAVDVAADSLRAHGVTDALVDLTGNMVAIGHPPGAPAWRIGIRDPRDRVSHFARVTLTDNAISTSGQYEQFIAANGRTYGHILDPRTGRPVDGLISVTLIGPTGLACDSWDTPMFVMGPAAARKVAREHPELGAVLVVPGTAGVDTAYVEESLRDRFTLDEAARPFMVVRWF
jgi:thiamine biosynthesis lipoprotein